MITLRVLKNGVAVDVRGKSQATIIQRIFGKSAFVWKNGDVNDRFVTVVRNDKYGNHILGQIEKEG